jgi:hypothetical protein
VWRSLPLGPSKMRACGGSWRDVYYTTGVSYYARSVTYYRMAAAEVSWEKVSSIGRLNTRQRAPYILIITLSMYSTLTLRYVLLPYTNARFATPFSPRFNLGYLVPRYLYNYIPFRLLKSFKINTAPCITYWFCVLLTRIF